MSYEAVFIGGPFDLTKRRLIKNAARVQFFEPLEPRVLTDKELLAYLPGLEEHVPCRSFTYERRYVTPGGVHIFEFSRTGGGESR